VARIDVFLLYFLFFFFRFHINIYSISVVHCFSKGELTFSSKLTFV
jgi:hypothetical protein